MRMCDHDLVPHRNGNQAADEHLSNRVVVARCGGNRGHARGIAERDADSYFRHTLAAAFLPDALNDTVVSDSAPSARPS